MKAKLQLLIEIEVEEPSGACIYPNLLGRSLIIRMERSTNNFEGAKCLASWRKGSSTMCVLDDDLNLITPFVNATHL